MQIAKALWVVLALFCTAQGGQQPAQSRITSVGLFKNGLAVVKRTVSVAEPGTYVLADVPEPVHGTFWVESDAKLTTRVTRRTVEVPEQAITKGDFQERLVGREVVVCLADSRIPPVAGRVVSLELAQEKDTWSRAYEQPRYYYGYYGAGYPGSRDRPPGTGSLLILETEHGRVYVDTAMIAYLEAKGAAAPVKQQRPVLLLSVGEMSTKPATIEISYLAKGMAWAPSYRVDLSDPKVLTLKQSAVIKNELEAIEDAEVWLISGFPSVQFAHVTSPLSLSTTWASFFTQLNQRLQEGGPATRNVMSQVAVNVAQPGPSEGVDLSAIPSGEGVDLHYQAIGKQTLAEGDSLALEIASASAAYERIVEWIVPDTRDAMGRELQDYDRARDPDRYQDAAWDAVRFNNPLPFPMTTGPAMVVSGGRFCGQRLSYWVNPGEQTTVHISKALSIRTQAVEYEQGDQRQNINVAGRRYQRSTVNGELCANNHRNESVTLVIRRRFSGELLEADQSPQCKLLEEGVWSVNKRNQLTWTLTLKPGAEARLRYRYTVLVPG